LRSFGALGVRQIVHRILSATPFLLVAVAGILATAFPEETKRLFWEANQSLGVAANRYLGLATILGYFLLWWFTSLPVETTRKKTQKSLRDFQSKLLAFQGSLADAGSDKEFDCQLDDLGALLKSMESWVENNMDATAVDRLVNPARPKGHFSYSGQGSTDPTFFSRRENILSLNYARLTALDDLIKNDGWDR
jgi:hypothetical protein